MTGIINTPDMQGKSNHRQIGKQPFIYIFLTFHSKIVLKAYFQEEELENARNLIHSVIGKASSRKFRKIVKSVSKPPKVPYLSSSCHEAQKKQDLG